MNCKPNDLAVCVNSHEYPELIGRIYRVVKPLDGGWLTDPPQFVPGYVLPAVFHDSTLRPLRDSDGQDETLTWQPLAQPTHA